MDRFSCEEHDRTQYTNDDLEFWKEHNKRHQKKEVYNNSEIRLDDLLKKYPYVRDTAIDIGSGAGWLSSLLSDVFVKVYAIEPSSKAYLIANKLYPDKKNITWICGFPNRGLECIPQLKSPCLVVTCSVLQHIRDNDVKEILSFINKKLPKNSILSLQELWGDIVHLDMHHSRSKEWWSSKLSNWDLDFHGPEVLEGISKGIHGVKNG